MHNPWTWTSGDSDVFSQDGGCALTSFGDRHYCQVSNTATITCPATKELKRMNQRGDMANSRKRPKRSGWLMNPLRRGARVISHGDTRINEAVPQHSGNAVKANWMQSRTQRRQKTQSSAGPPAQDDPRRKIRSQSRFAAQLAIELIAALHQGRPIAILPNTIIKKPKRLEGASRCAARNLTPPRTSATCVLRRAFPEKAEGFISNGP